MQRALVSTVARQPHYKLGAARAMSSSSTFAGVPMGPPDPILGLSALAREQLIFSKGMQPNGA